MTHSVLLLYILRTFYSARLPASQLVMRGQGHKIRSSLWPASGRGGITLRGLGRRCHMALTTPLERL